MSDTKKRTYELVLVQVTQEAPDLVKSTAEIEAGFAKREAEVLRKEDWGERKLFHEKDHHLRGVFSFYALSAYPAAISQIAADLKVNSAVLKNVIIRNN